MERLRFVYPKMGNQSALEKREINMAAMQICSGTSVAMSDKRKHPPGEDQRVFFT
jgi:hypothetical protein